MRRRRDGFDVCGSVADEGDFEVVDEGGAVHGEEVMKPRRMRSMSRGPRPTLMTWPPMPQRMALRCLRLVDGGEEIAEVSSGEEVGKGGEEFGERGIGGGAWQNRGR